MNAGDYLDGIDFEIRSYDGNYRKKFHFGGFKGGTKKKVTFDDDEFLSNINLAKGEIVDSIEICTNKRDYGRYGGTGGTGKTRDPKGYYATGFKVKAGSWDGIALVKDIHLF